MLRRLRLPTIRYDFVGNRLNFIFVTMLNSIIWIGVWFAFFWAVTSILPCHNLMTTLSCYAIPGY